VVLPSPPLSLLPLCPLSYQTQEAAARAADLGRLALLGPQPDGKPYNFPLASYTPEQQQQRTGGLFECCNRLSRHEAP
jgi:hypothetical protein